MADYVNVYSVNGRCVPLENDLFESVLNQSDYYTFCTSTDFNWYMFREFDSDACVVITNVEEFCRRVQVLVSEKLPGWYFHHNPVQYFDPCERASDNESFCAVTSKDFKYSYQKEYRFSWENLGGYSIPVERYIDLEIGSIRDISEYIEVS